MQRFLLFGALGAGILGIGASGIAKEFVPRNCPEHLAVAFADAVLGGDGRRGGLTIETPQDRVKRAQELAAEIERLRRERTGGFFDIHRFLFGDPDEIGGFEWWFWAHWLEKNRGQISEDLANEIARRLLFLAPRIHEPVGP